MADDVETVEVAGRTLDVTSPGKVFFEERGDTKLDLIRYYLAVEEPVLRTMGGRPVLMQRFPHGATGSSFFQKRVPANAPDWLDDHDRRDPERHDVAGLGRGRPGPRGVGRQPGLSRVPRVALHRRRPGPCHRADGSTSIPQPGIEFESIREAAAEVRRLFDELGVVGFPKTTGNRGIHVYVRLEPRWDSIAVRASAVAVARELARRRPDLITDAWWKEERGRRVFVDFNQNAPHKTVFGAWSARARAGGQVSTPLRLGRDRQPSIPTTSPSPTCPPGWRPPATRGRR